MDIVDILDQLQFVFITMAEFDYEIYEMGIKLGLIERNNKKRMFDEEMKRLEAKKKEEPKVTAKKKTTATKTKTKKLQLKRKQLQLKKEQPKEKIVRIFKNIIKTVDLFYTKSFVVFSF